MSKGEERRSSQRRSESNNDWHTTRGIVQGERRSSWRVGKFGIDRRTLAAKPHYFDMTKMPKLEITQTLNRGFMGAPVKFELIPEKQDKHIGVYLDACSTRWKGGYLVNEHYTISDDQYMRVLEIFREK